MVGKQSPLFVAWLTTVHFQRHFLMEKRMKPLGEWRVEMVWSLTRQFLPGKFINTPDLGFFWCLCMRKFVGRQRKKFVRSTVNSPQGCPLFTDKLGITYCFGFREAKFKRALRVHFLTHFTKHFCRFLPPKVKSGTDMTNPSSIESSDFLFWHKKQFWVGFLKNLWIFYQICGKWKSS